MLGEIWFLVYIKMIYPFTAINNFSLLLILLDAHLAVWGQQRVPGLGEVCEELSGLVSKVPGVEHEQLEPVTCGNESYCIEQSCVILVRAVIKRILSDSAIVDTLQGKHIVTSLWKCSYYIFTKDGSEILFDIFFDKSDNVIFYNFDFK